MALSNANASIFVRTVSTSRSLEQPQRATPAFAGPSLHRCCLHQAVVHASGALTDASLWRQSAAGVRCVTAPKGVSVNALTPRLAPHPTRLHMMFSSLAAVLPSAGQANYAAANAELDSAAQRCTLLLVGTP